MSFEIDQRLIPVLEDTLAPYDNVTIINEDILKANISKAVHTHLSDCENHGCGKFTLLYYYAYIIKFNATRYTYRWLCGNDAKEVGERLNATVGTKAYGSLSIVAQYYTETSKSSDSA